jgi:uncharacterized membrane protein YfcA
MDWILIIVIAIIFVSGFVRSAFGFGDSVLAMPLLALFISIKTATPLVGLCAVTYSILILYKEWHHIKFKDVLVLIITAFIGIPIGIYLLKGSYENSLKLILGSVIVIFSLFNIFKPKLIFLKNDKLAFVFGFIAGILGGAYNTAGPPVVIYSALRKWNPRTFRATMQGFFLPTGFMIIIGHFFVGLWTQEVLLKYIIALPFILLAIYLGALVNKRIHKDRFNIYIFSILLLAGVLLIIKNI